MAITGRFELIGYILLPDFKNGGSLDSDGWSTFWKQLTRANMLHSQPTACQRQHISYENILD